MSAIQEVQKQIEEVRENMKKYADRIAEITVNSGGGGSDTVAEQ